MNIRRRGQNKRVTHRKEYIRRVLMEGTKTMKTMWWRRERVEDRGRRARSRESWWRGRLLGGIKKERRGYMQWRG